MELSGDMAWAWGSKSCDSLSGNDCEDMMFDLVNS